MDRALIIFQKNPELGKVKTRLAETIGKQNALLIYTVLVEHTHQIVCQIDAKKYLYFSNYVENNLKSLNYTLKVQNGQDLGERMLNAISEVIQEGAKQVVLLGTDCYELTHEIIENAFHMLETNDYCIGPAVDGGYYLIGTTFPDGVVFLGKQWSTETVMEEAKKSIQNLGKKMALLETLSDVDYEVDLKSLRIFLQ